MGLLDDAIREHLELKRRHGADPQEVERQEHEALGAARRGEFAATSEAEDEARSAAPFDIAADVPEGPPEFDDRTRTVDEVDAPPEPEIPEAGEQAAAPGYDEDPWLDEERDEVPSEESLERGPESFDREGGDEPLDREGGEPPTDRAAGEDTPDRGAAEPSRDSESGEEDVLEETPDFLQETPEHDRLWFEQRPPRDFDWDK
jgi:hypothetical protein